MSGRKMSNDSFGRSRKRRLCPETPHEPLPDLPRREVQARVKAAVDAIGAELPRIEKSHDALANTLVELLFRGNPAYALDPTKHPTAEYKALQAVAGVEVRLDSGALSRHVRAGALNLILGPDSAWGRLPWTYRVELLPLVELDGAGRFLALGIEEASKPDASVRSIQAWKKLLKEELVNEKPTVRGMTLSNAKRLIAHGDRLGSKRAQTEFLKKLARLPDDEQSAIVDQMVASTRNVVAMLNRYAEVMGTDPFAWDGAPEQEAVDEEEVLA